MRRPLVRPRRSKQDRRRRYPKAFEHRARAYLEANPLCIYCREAGRVTESELVDHVTPITKGGSVMDPANWSACCRACHDGWIKTLERGGGSPRLGVGADGRPRVGPTILRAIEGKASDEHRERLLKHMKLWV